MAGVSAESEPVDDNSAPERGNSPESYAIAPRTNERVPILIYALTDIATGDADEERVWTPLVAGSSLTVWSPASDS